MASYALALIGLFNVFGTYIAGSLGQRLAKRKILAFIYLGRAVAIALFLWVPLSPLSVYVFAGGDGPAVAVHRAADQRASWRRSSASRTCRCWAASSSFSHQVGSFLGVWLGGFLYDRTGSYDIVWYIAIALGVFAALINLPVKESAIARPAPQPAWQRHGAIATAPTRSRSIAGAPVGSAAPAPSRRRVVLAAVFVLYTRPDFLVMMVDQIWACF